MNQQYSTEQEAFWAGEFGDNYINRNRGEDAIASNTMLLSKMLARIGPIQSAIEFGANIGLNLLALRSLLPAIKLGAVEINSLAARKLRSIKNVDVYEQSILKFTAKTNYDLTFTRGGIDPYFSRALKHSL